VIDLLRSLPTEDGNDHVFIGAHAGGGLSNMALARVARRMGFDVTIHGFHSSFRTWCAEQTNFPSEVAEAALAHAIPNAVLLIAAAS
jgi:integrase